MAERSTLPQRVLSFYGDDFTGSTDTMEVMAMAGLKTVLFLSPPDDAMLAKFPEARVIGVAGISRSQDVTWMQKHLPPIFAALRSTGAPYMHYKVCSTFDSGPEVGNIGCATELGKEAFPDDRPIPLLVGAPNLQRYVAFGNLYAGMHGTRYRIDRHPVMSRHPVTPMAEADLRLHLARQTNLTVGLVDLPQLAGLDVGSDWLRQVQGDADVLLFDTVDAASLLQAGRLVRSLRSDRPIFAVGSSGFEYALVAAWREAGLLPVLPTPRSASQVDRLLVVSGSCSPVTAAQIRDALQSGFVGIRLDARQLVQDPSAMEAAVHSSLETLASGRDVLLYTAIGPDDAGQVELSGSEMIAFNDQLGAVLGLLMKRVLQESHLRRAVVAGGDTSSHAVRQLGLHALTFAAPVAPGSPLCIGHAEDAELSGLEIALKGGQMGQNDFFLRVKNGVT
jgi:3-oxoisoapionate kinase